MKRVLQIEMLDGKAAPLMAGCGLGSIAIVRGWLETPSFNRDGSLVIFSHCELLRSQAAKSSSGEDAAVVSFFVIVGTQKSLHVGDKWRSRHQGLGTTTKEEPENR